MYNSYETIQVPDLKFDKIELNIDQPSINETREFSEGKLRIPLEWFLQNLPPELELKTFFENNDTWGFHFANFIHGSLFYNDVVNLKLSSLFRSLVKLKVTKTTTVNLKYKGVTAVVTRSNWENLASIPIVETSNRIGSRSISLEEINVIRSQLTQGKIETQTRQYTKDSPTDWQGNFHITVPVKIFFISDIVTGSPKVEVFYDLPKLIQGVGFGVNNSETSKMDNEKGRGPFGIFAAKPTISTTLLDDSRRQAWNAQKKNRRA
jgi:hypothetical protein